MSDDEGYYDEDITDSDDEESDIEDTESDISTVVHEDTEHIVTSKPLSSRPVMTSFEYARLKGILMMHISEGYDVGEVPADYVTPSQIATWLITEKRYVPFTILRPTRGSEMEPVDASHLLIV